MRKVFLILTPVFLALGVFLTIIYFLTQASGKGALQVTSNPQSRVLVNGKYIGMTPLCRCEGAGMMDVGEYTIRIEPPNGLAPFEEKITIAKSILTVVDRTFGKGVGSEGSIVSLSPLDKKDKLQLLVVSFPPKASVLVDGNKTGEAPLLLDQLTTSDHEVVVKKTGYKDKIIRIHTVSGYKLSVVAYLGQSEEALKPTPTITPAIALTPTPAPTVLILQTPTGFLRVRDNNDVNAAEIARVTPGESYPLIAEETGWFKISLSDGREGWISSQYGQKQ